MTEKEKEEGFVEDPAKKGTQPSGEPKVITQNIGGEGMGASKQVAVWTLIAIFAVLGIWGMSIYGKSSGENVNNLQPQLTQAQVGQIIDAKVDAAKAAMAASGDEEVDSQAVMAKTSKELLAQGANEAANDLELNWHKAALEQKGLDRETAEFHSTAIHIVSAMDPSFKPTIKKTNMSLLDKVLSGMNQAGVNTGDIVGLKETDKLLEANTLANTAANIRRDPSSKDIEKYIPLPKLAEYGYVLGQTDKINAAAYGNEMAARDKKDKKLSSRIWRNTKDLDGFHGKGLSWNKKVSGNASVRLEKITLATE
jgi:hypothetical protein